MWRLGENLDVKYSLAARLVSRLSGAARRACVNMPESSLMPVRGADAVMASDGRTVETPAMEEDLAAGITAVMEKLKQMLHPEPLVSRGEALSAFFKGSRYHRRHGQRLTEFIAIFEEGLERLRQEGRAAGT